MTKTVKKILSVFLVLSILNWMFVFADEKFVSDMSIIDIKEVGTWEEIKSFAIWDFVETENDSILFNYNWKVSIEVWKNSKYKFNDFYFWELLEWKVSVSSSFEYILQSWDLKINLKNSWIILEKNDSKINILSKYWINEISYKWENFLLIEWNSISIDEENFSKSENIFSQIEKNNFSQNEIIEKWKIFPEDKHNDFNLSWLSKNILSSLIVFENKNKEWDDFLIKEKFNDCIYSISELTKNEKAEVANISKYYNDFEEKCINDDILKNEEFLEKFYKTFEDISVLKEKYLIDEKIKKFLWEEFSFIEKIFYLQQNISSADSENFSFFLEEIRNASEKEFDLKDLETWFILVDWILKNNLQFSFEKIYDFREKILFKVLENFYDSEWEKLNFYTQKMISLNFDFIDSLLESWNYKELDYIFANKIIFENPKETDSLKIILENYDKSFEDYRTILDSSKNVLHWSAEDNNIEEIKKEELEKQEQELEIKKMLDSFKLIKEDDLEVTSEEQKIEIVKIFKEFWLEVLPENIEWFMEWWSLFYVNQVEYLENKYDLVFDISRKIVSKIKWEKFDWEWSMELSRFKNLLSSDSFTASTFNSEPMNVFQNIEEKDFSQSVFLKKELVRKYLETVWIIVDNKNISEIDSEKYLVEKAKIEQYSDLEISFNIKLIEWKVLNVSFFEWLNSELKTKYAKNLKSWIEKIYWDYILREENVKKVITDLASLWINRKDIFLSNDSVDWFEIYKWFQMSSWDAILSWEYFVWKKLFSKARFTLWEHFEDFEDVSVSDLSTRIKFINKNINDLDKLKTEEELARIKEQQRLEQIRVLNYWEEVPDELLNWDWITD